MKLLLLTCCLFVVRAAPAGAQVTKFAFTEKVITLHSFITQKNTIGESNLFLILNNMMTGQINYLNSSIIVMIKKYSADTTKSNADLNSAKSSPDRNSPQIIAARNETKQTA